MSFRDDFVWGGATASCQVEGAAFEDGKGESVWDRFCQWDGKVYQKHTPSVACDQYHLYREDVSLMKEMGMKAYRFSISWPRVLPNGVGEINEKGLEYYDRLIDELLENGIEPYITIYHWDLPQVLQDQGGWQNPKIVDWFAEYSKLLAERYSDRVKFWFTLNEPQVFSQLGYRIGNHAPGLKVGEKEYFLIVHNLLKAHGIAVKMLRTYGKQEVLVGTAVTGGFYYPETENEKEIEVARKLTFQCADTVDGNNWNLALMCDPVFFGKYPDDVVAKYGHLMPPITKEDMELISQPMDFFGFNIYNGVMVNVDEVGNGNRVERYTGFAKTTLNWPVTPEAIQWATKFIYERYQKPIYITENGMACHDWISLDGKVHDSQRVDFIHRYLIELRKSTMEGVDIRGYFAWSLLDNFEWSDGYNERFGLIYVDYRTQQRMRKDSSYFYEEVIKANGENL